MSFTLHSPRRLAPAQLTLVAALILTLVGPAARAVTTPQAPDPAPGTSSVADQTWGVLAGPDGRAPRVRALAVVGRSVFLGGDFTTMVPPGSRLPPTTTSTTSSTSTTTTSRPTTPSSVGPNAVAPQVTTAEPLVTSPSTGSTATTSTTRPAPTTTTTRWTLPAGSQTRNHLAALDVDHHTLLPWNPDVDGPVYAMVVSADATQLYVGGNFGHIGGTAVSNLARIDVATGKVDPTFRSGVRGGIRALALSGDRLYVGGVFNSIAGPAGSEARPKLAALDAASGDLLPWMPPAMGPGRYVGHNGTPTLGPSGDVLAVAVPADGSRVYVGGNFMNFGGQAGLLDLDADTGLALPEQWKTGRPIFDLAVSPDDGQTVYASAGGSGGMVYAFNPADPKRPVWTTWVDGDAPGVSASDSTVYVMGHYDYAGPTNDLRHHLAALDAGNGTVDPWNPTANTPWGAFSSAVGADHVFVGGEFTRINGSPQPGFAQFAVPPPRPPTTTTVTTTSTTTTSSTTTTTTTTTAKPTVAHIP
jgi:hypothetical protein